MKTKDLFDVDPKPNSPEDLGGMFVPRAERRAREKREPKPWNPEHKDHPSQRPENQLQPGETAPSSWNVATSLGIMHMRTFLTWCDEQSIDRGGHTVGTLYVALNAHSIESFRWLCQSLKRSGLEKLPSAAAMSKAILARDVALLYSSTD